MHQYNVSAGGSGGQPGFYIFIHTVSDAAHVPKTMLTVGANGPNGPDAAACKTNAADVYCDISTSKSQWGTKV